jgi:hypothetical protein
MIDDLIIIIFKDNFVRLLKMECFVDMHKYVPLSII